MTLWDFDGETYETERDGERLAGQLGRVRDALLDREWHTLAEPRGALPRIGGRRLGAHPRPSEAALRRLADRARIRRPWPLALPSGRATRRGDPMTETEATTDPQTLALLRNDVRGLTKAQIGDLVATLTERAGIDPALAPIDLITDKQTGAIRVYFNARGAAELAKRRDLSDDELDIDIRESVVIAKLTMTDPVTGRRRTDVGASGFKPDWPDSLANAIKKASTSAHRRVTMGMVGIFIDEPLVDPE